MTMKYASPIFSILCVLGADFVDAKAGLPDEIAVLRPALRELCQLSPAAERSRADQEIAALRSRVRSLYLIPQVSLTADFGIKDGSDAKPAAAPEDSATGSKGMQAGIAEGTLTSPFGMREHPIEGGKKFHPGIDIAGAVGTPIHAWGDGTVVASFASKTGGNMIVAEHKDAGPGGKTLYSRYLHNNSNLVKTGDEIKKGQVIAQMGSTGNSTGPHSHFELRENNATGQEGALNPMTMASNGPTTTKEDTGATPATSTKSDAKPEGSTEIQNMNQTEMVNKYVDEQMAGPDMARNAIQAGMSNISSDINKSMGNTNTALGKMASNITTIGPTVSNAITSMNNGGGNDPMKEVKDNDLIQLLLGPSM